MLSKAVYKISLPVVLLATSLLFSTPALGADPNAQQWPGGSSVTAQDPMGSFYDDSSGIDFQEANGETFLWLVDNGTGTFWKVTVDASGAFQEIPGWENGKRIRFQEDAGNPAAAGPDTEGISVSDSGTVYFAAEGDNSHFGVNRNVILAVDPDKGSGDLVADSQWDITSTLPAVPGNKGIEGIEWISDADLAGALIDDNTGAAYDPSNYPGHGDGLVFVAMETGGQVYALALNADGTHTLVATIDSGLPAAMALDWDPVLNQLWVACDDTCDGDTALLTLGQSTPTIYSAAADLPNVNNEGFATSSLALCVNGQRPVWWFEDGVAVNSLRSGTLSCPIAAPTPTASAIAKPAPTVKATVTASATAVAVPVSSSAAAAGEKSTKKTQTDEASGNLQLASTGTSGPLTFLFVVGFSAVGSGLILLRRLPGLRN